MPWLTYTNWGRREFISTMIRSSADPLKFSLSQDAMDTFEKHHDSYEDIVHEKACHSFVSGRNSPLFSLKIQKY